MTVRDGVPKAIVIIMVIMYMPVTMQMIVAILRKLDLAAVAI